MKNVALVCLTAIIYYGCSNASSSSQPLTQTKGQESSRDQPMRDSPSHNPIDLGFFSNAQGVEAWQAFTGDGQFRWAKADDFQIPDWAMKPFGRDIKKKIKHPIEGGDINHDGAYNDFAAIVIDTTLEVKERFGVVIFNEPKESQEKYSTYWLYSNEDLSNTVLGWSSDGLSILKYYADGSYSSGNVKWDPKMQKYSCDPTRFRWRVSTQR